MTQREFIYKLAKILSEDYPLTYTVNGNIPDISVSEPLDAKPFIFLPKPMDIGADEVPGSRFEVYVEYSGRRDTLGRFADPQDAAERVGAYFTKRYGKQIEQVSSKDYTYCNELSDFLEFNGIPSHSMFKYDKSGAEIIVDHDSFPLQYRIGFSEYRGEVFVTVNEDYEADSMQIYRSVLNEQTKKKVFTDILKTLRSFHAKEFS